jgi:catechol 2,3-dioxygenase-like lactoylglutathione lyase family enzyme
MTSGTVLRFPRYARRGESAILPDMGVDVTGVSELVLEVVDLEASERFYAGVLGLPVVERWPEREAIWVMAGDRTRIGLWRPQVGLHGGRGGIHVHFAMHIAADRYDAAVAHLRGQGEEVIEQAFGNRGRALYVYDPDGNVVELWTWNVGEHLSGPPDGATSAGT